MRILRGPHLLDPTDARFSTGTAEQQRQARDEWRRERFIAQVANSELKEIPRADLERLWFGILENTKTGDLYLRDRGGLVDLAYSNAVAYFLDVTGTPVLLTRPPGPKTRAELEARDDAREARRNQPKPKPEWAHRP